mmetsp:Transcript_74354/g.187325  ORF Transcript_74354/g.187325 Transcript_74354/m.187325 type:complete len:233 (-) Transcript_74354:75-773(-)|eukprot:CAMPEP_0115253892 /NCGR_PEP_ID=MMETSP0270-20121206/44908_1 /TAXON_ID=71861 /ORGANISM="Scrippsiella trochoidea, Strain CCMP3099" /LENGTH=232 /DNA_ID=CAMNT_0002669415 /DNA_START=75 /DNA_END=773 /DNA_ORIENTATION=+
MTDVSDQALEQVGDDLEHLARGFQIKVGAGKAWPAQQCGRSLLRRGSQVLVNGATNATVADHRVPDPETAEFILRAVRDRSPQGCSHEALLKVARITRAAKGGNCHECASFAYAYLFTKGFYPIRFMSFPPRPVSFDHCFIVLGEGDAATVIDLWKRVGGRIEWEEMFPFSELDQKVSAADFQALQVATPRGELVPFHQHQNLYTCNVGGSIEQYRAITGDQEIVDLMDMSK